MSSRAKPVRKRESATAFAPATVANVAVGFDILGLALSGVGDLVTVSARAEAGVRIEEVVGIPAAADIPQDPAKNTAGLPLLKMLEEASPGFGFSVRIEKGIPLGSGMGGSAASAVGAVVAANAVLGDIFSREKLLAYALEGEALASGSKHADNVAPCLFGGLALSFSCENPDENPSVISLPFPRELLCVVVNPSLRLDTKDARAVLKPDLPLKTHVRQSVRLAAFIAGCCTGNPVWIGDGLEDVVIEPQRARLIPGFSAVKAAALEAGALGCSISGAGPSVFALTIEEKIAERVRAAMIRAFSGTSGLVAQGWISPISEVGACLL